MTTLRHPVLFNEQNPLRNTGQVPVTVVQQMRARTQQVTRERHSEKIRTISIRSLLVGVMVSMFGLFVGERATTKIKATICGQ